MSAGWHVMPVPRRLYRKKVSSPYAESAGSYQKQSCFRHSATPPACLCQPPLTARCKYSLLWTGSWRSMMRHVFQFKYQSASCPAFRPSACPRHGGGGDCLCLGGLGRRGCRGCCGGRGHSGGNVDGFVLMPMSAAHRPHPSEDGEPLPPGEKPVHSPAELPVEPDLGPVPPLAHPEEPGTVQPVI